MADGDLAYSLEQLHVVAEGLRDFDMVIGVRQSCSRSLLRRLLGETFNRLARIVFAFSHPDTQAGLKGLRRSAAVDVYSRSQISHYAIDVEMLVIAKRLKFGV